MGLRARWPGAALAATLAACSLVTDLTGFTGASGGARPDVPGDAGLDSASDGVAVSPGFQLVVTPTPIDLAAGGVASVSIALARRGGFDGNVTVTVTGLPAGVTTSPVSVVIPQGGSSAPITFAAPPTQPTATTSLTFTGVDLASNAAATAQIDLAVHPAAGGTLDPTFGQGGFTTTPMTANPADSASAEAMATQPDGRIVLAGLVEYATSHQQHFALARYNTDGTLDLLFGPDNRGTIVRDVTPVGAALGVVVQPDGKIVAGGYGLPLSTNGFMLARWDRSGFLDPSFGTGGLVATVIGTASYGYALGLERDGRLLMAGTAGSASGGRLGVARYLDDGGLDPSFGEAGTTVAAGAAGRAQTIAVQADDRIVVGAGGGVGIVVVRFAPDGALDPSFGDAGVTQAALADAGVQAAAVALQADQKVVVVAEAPLRTGLQGDSLVARYNAAGSLDATFGASGIAAGGVGLADGSSIAGAVQSDGKIVVVGFSQGAGGALHTLVTRYLPGGVLDPTFGTAGRVVSKLGDNDVAHAVAIQPDGKILVAGFASSATSSGSFFVARYLP